MSALKWGCTYHKLHSQSSNNWKDTAASLKFSLFFALGPLFKLCMYVPLARSLSPSLAPLSKTMVWRKTANLPSYYQLQFFFFLSFEKYNLTFSPNATRPAIFVVSTSKITVLDQNADDGHDGNTPVPSRRKKWVMYILIKQRLPGIALTWWWTHPGHFPCKKSTFLSG